MYNDELIHYGTKRHSGRYEWGSGKNPYQHESWFLGERDRLKAQGMTDTEIAKAMNMSTLEFRTKRTLENNAKTAADATNALKLKDKGYSNVEIGNILGVSEGTVRRYLNPAFEMRKNKSQLLADTLKEQVAEKPYLDVGRGVELQLGVSKQQLKPALALLEEQGYKVSQIKVEQATNPGKYTYVQVLTKDDVPYSDIYKNRDKIMSPHGVWFEDMGTTKRGIKPPVSVDSSRVAIRYAEDGGRAKDGVIELRRGVDDISLGQNTYAQVRIAVDGTHYLKGMAVYSDDLPPGVDILFNTNKHKDKSKMEVLKKMDDDPDNPFGSTIRQRTYTDKNGKEQLSAINIVNEDADWEKWSKTLSSQFLSKQPKTLAKQQLDLAYKEKKQEYDDICALNNPAVKQRLLESFADDCDSAAVHLKAAPLPGQKTHVILPLTKIKDTEVYAPNYTTGEEVILVRHPHQGVFEIPRLTVNNRNPQGRNIIGQAQNAIGISATVAEQLSGADFDGDTVLVIPTKNHPIKTSKPLKGLEGFDPKEYYRAYEGMPKTGPDTGFHKQSEMGKISNLITDMTIKGATPDEIVRATKHSLTVIDAEKHNLDWRRSEQENGIKQLKTKYQGGPMKGAATLISRAKSEQRVDQRKEYRLTKNNKNPSIDPITGEKIFQYTGDTWTDKKGVTRKRQDVSTKMYEAKDANELSTGTAMEGIYADYANKMKALGNQARKEWLATPNLEYSPSARKTYQAEVDSLNHKLNIAKKNAPNERKAQLVADVIYRAKLESNPQLRNDKSEASKVRAQIIQDTRNRAGTTSRESRNITITDREWEAIQAGAIHHSKLAQILNNTDLDTIRERATPRDTKKRGMSSSAVARAKAMIRMGYPQSEVAKAVGVSVSTLKNNNVI